MADFGSPVAQNVNPQQGLKTLSDLLAIKQQRQTLETGAFTQESAKAKATVDTQGAQENQAVVQALQDPIGGGFIDQKGNPTVDGLTRFLKIAPTSGAERYGKFVDAARSRVDFNSSLNSLNAGNQAEIGSTLSGAAAGAKSFGEIESAANLLKEQKKGTPLEGDYNRLIDASMHIIRQGGDPMADPKNVSFDRQQQAALVAGRKVLGAAGVVGAGGIANPQQTSNAAGQTQNRDPITGALSAPQVGPGTSNPASPQVASATARATGTAGSDIDRSNEIASLQQQSSAAIPLTKRIDELSHEIASGNLAKKISETGNWLGFSSVNEARSQLNKDLGQVKALAIQRAGSDSRAATVLEGYPTDTTPENTVHAAMDYIRGTAKQNLARGKILSQYQKDDPQGLRGLQAADNVMTGSTNPLMHEYLSLKPDEQKGFYRRNFSTPEQAQAFKDQVNALKKHSRVFDSQ